MPSGITRPPSLLSQKEIIMNAIQEAQSLAAFRAQVDAGVLEALKADGYVREDEGVEVADNDALALRLRDIVRDTKSSTTTERQQKAVPRGTLAALAFPSTPSPSSPLWNPDDEVASQVWKNLKGLVSRLTQTGRRGKVQQLFAEDGLILCPAKVGDNKDDAVYVTNEPKLILADFAVPRTSKLQNVSEEVAQDFNLVTNRIPGMGKQMKTKLESGMKAAQLAARAKLAITAGDDDAGDNDEDES
jgi:hypothetical protein